MNPEQRIAHLLVKVIETLWLVIPIWYFLYVLKGILALYVKRNRLKKSLLINIDGKFEIAGKRGQLVFFGWWYLTLKRDNGEHHHVPMLTAVDSIITRLDHINGKAKRRTQ
jgi:hypothetical protein